MNTWHYLDTSKFMKPEADSERGVRVELSLSPYDVPEAVRGYFSEDIRRFVIEFRYIQDEPWERREAGEHVTLRVGKGSQRLYGIEVDVETLSADSVTLAIESAKDAINSLAADTKSRHVPKVPSGNLKTLKAVVSGSYKNIQKGLRESARLAPA